MIKVTPTLQDFNGAQGESRVSVKAQEHRKLGELCRSPGESKCNLQSGERFLREGRQEITSPDIRWSTLWNGPGLSCSGNDALDSGTLRVQRSKERTTSAFGSEMLSKEAIHGTARLKIKKKSLQYQNSHFSSVKDFCEKSCD